MLIGRLPEIQRLEKVYQSSEAEFVVLYGRRRVGKTFLIREFFQRKSCQFLSCTGLKKGTLAQQLKHFSEAVSETFTHGISLQTPASWEEAFKSLTQFIDKTAVSSKTVIFLDELPWMATPRSGLLTAIDYYWNQYWSKNPKLILIVCGSSASWLIKNIIYNQGGLHNRCTCEIKLDPFDLAESAAFLKSKAVKLSDRHVLDLYMALGGIPYYLKYVEPGFTATENIQNILFSSKAPLKEEFQKLFSSLFRDAASYIELIELIATKREGISRATLEKLLLTSGGRLTQRLENLRHTNFIEDYTPWNKERHEYYKIIDEFCLFYQYWLKELQGKKIPPDYWVKQATKARYHTWAGYAFEAICHKHTSQIIQALNIKTAEQVSAWKLSGKKAQSEGAQIDLLIDRSDDAITICEIKYTTEPFAIDKAYAEKLKKKMEIFKKHTRTTKQIFLVIISANGLKPTMYSEEMIDGVVTLQDLIKK